MKVLVTGATGQVGHRVVEELVKRGADVRTYSRKAPAAGRFPAGVEVAVGDLLDPVALTAAMEGVDKLFLLNSVASDELTQGLIAYGVARRKRLRQVVYLSVFRVPEFHDVPHFASKTAIETALREFGLPFTILRPGYFFQNDLRLRDILHQGIYPMPLGGTGIAAVDTRDLAEAAAIALTSTGHEGQTYNLVGPAVISGPGAAAIWSRALGREVRYPGENFDAWEQQARQQMPAWMAYDLRTMLQAYLERGFLPTAADVARCADLLGHAPRAYDALAREAAAAWK